MPGFIKNLYRRIRKLFHYENPVEKQMFVEQAKRIVALSAEVRFLSRAIADPNGLGMLQLRLYNLHVPKQFEYMFFEMQPGDICIDCGANQGLFTDLVLSRGGIVHSFEPNPVLFRELSGKYKNSPNVFIYQQAVSNKSGVATFRLPVNMNENYLVNTESGTVDVWDSHLDDYKGQQATDFSVPLVSLADFLINHVLPQGNVYLLKLDVEGSEFDILPQLIEMELYKKVKYIVCETHERFISSGSSRLEEIKAVIARKQITNIFLDWI